MPKLIINHQNGEVWTIDNISPRQTSQLDKELDKIAIGKSKGFSIETGDHRVLYLSNKILRNSMVVLDLIKYPITPTEKETYDNTEKV